MLFLRYRLISTIYLCLANPNPSQSLSALSSYNIKKVAEEWEIWDKEEEAVKLEAEAKKLVPEKFHKWIKVFGKKQLERMPTRKIWDHAIDMKEGFVLRKGTSDPQSHLKWH